MGAFFSVDAEKSETIPEYKKNLKEKRRTPNKKPKQIDVKIIDAPHYLSQLRK